MIARVYSCPVNGLDGVVVEVDYTAGFLGMTILGQPDALIQESRERVQAAVRNAVVPCPRKRLVVNLAPASVRKEGPAYDLPIAAGGAAPGRTTQVRDAHAGSAAPAAGRQGGNHQPGAGFVDLSGFVPTGGGDESVSKRIHTIEHSFRV